jgi:hypothetical protein
MELRDLINSLHTTQSSYHHHKETMAYAGTALYLSAASAVSFKGPKIWDLGTQRIWTLVLLIFTAAISFAFVGWQLFNRRRAANIVNACIDLSTALISSDATPDVAPYQIYGLTLPKCLADRINKITSDRCCLQVLPFSELLTYLIMFAWTVFAGFSINR